MLGTCDLAEGDAHEDTGGVHAAFTGGVIATAAHIAVSVFATDLDGDGDTDVLSASLAGNTIAWYENGGGLAPTFTGARKGVRMEWHCRCF